MARITASTSTSPPRMGGGPPRARLSPTPEQEAIVQGFLRGEDMVIEAGAGCLAADTIVHLNRGGKGFRSTIEHVARQRAGTAVVTRQLYGQVIRQGARPWDPVIPTYVARADNGIVRLASLANAWYSGVKPTFELITEGGRSIRATAEHPFLTIDGRWLRLEQLCAGISLAVSTGHGTNGKTAPKCHYQQVFTRFHPHQVRDSWRRPRFKVPMHRLVVEAQLNEMELDDFIHVLRTDEEASSTLQFLARWPEVHVHHRDENWANNEHVNLATLTGAEHHRHHAGIGEKVLWQIASDRIARIIPFGEEPTFDIEVADSPHNFIANDFVVHNTGKTSTLRLIADAAPQRRGIYLAYNKAIAADAQGSFPASVKASTAHSLAFRAVGRRYAERLNGPRLFASEVARILGVKQGLEIEGNLVRPKHLARMAIEGVQRFCWSGDPYPAQWHVEKLPLLGAAGQVALEDAVLPLMNAIWADLQQVSGRMKFTHDTYLKIWQLTEPTLSCDFVLLDEAQDANPVIAKVVERQTHARRILVGDQAQAIYGWRGAVDAMAGFAGRRYPLSQSFRFGEPIAEEANKWLELLEARLRLRGLEGIESQLEPLEEPAAVLCRTNAESVAQAMSYQRQGRRAALVGGGVEVQRLAEAAITLKQGQGTDHPELFLFQDWTQVEEFVEEEQAGQDLKVFVKLINRYTPEGVLATINRLHPEAQAEVVISTAHKAKGREWNSVQIAPDFPEPDEEEGERLNASEARLAYVAVTRGRFTLDRYGLAWIDAWLQRRRNTHGGKESS